MKDFYTLLIALVGILINFFTWANIGIASIGEAISTNQAIVYAAIILVSFALIAWAIFRFVTSRRPDGISEEISKLLRPQLLDLRRTISWARTFEDLSIIYEDHPEEDGVSRFALTAFAGFDQSKQLLKELHEFNIKVDGIAKPRTVAMSIATERFIPATWECLSLDSYTYALAMLLIGKKIKKMLDKLDALATKELNRERHSYRRRNSIIYRFWFKRYMAQYNKLVDKYKAELDRVLRNEEGEQFLK